MKNVKFGKCEYKAVCYAPASYKRIAKEFRRLSYVYAEKFKFSREISTFDRVKSRKKNITNDRYNNVLENI